MKVIEFRSRAFTAKIECALLDDLDAFLLTHRLAAIE
jgi:hypothetical protein